MKNTYMKSVIGILICVFFVFLLNVVWVNRVESPGDINSVLETSVLRVNTSGGTFGYKALLANTPSLREKGLSGRAGLGTDEAMLFVFDDVSKHQFWMKDMLFAIDIVWLDVDKRVVHIEQSVKPESFPKSYGPDEDSKYVLEFKEGVVNAIGLEVGDKADF